MRIFLLLLCLSPYALAEMDIPKIKVQGKCDIKVVPDRGSITFSSENQSKDQAEAVKKTNSQINELKKALEKLRLKDSELKNTGYSVYPVREWSKDKLIHKGYRASLSLEITTSEISRIGEAMMIASDKGITNVGSLEMYLSDKKAQEEYLKCLEIAADDAKLKAKKLASKLGFDVGEVIHLDETPQMELMRAIPVRGMMKSMSLAESAPTQIEAGTQKFSTNIDVTFKIK